MGKRRLLWQLFFLILLLVLPSLFALTWFTTRAVRQFYLESVESDLEARARLVEGRLLDNVGIPSGTEVNDICRELGSASRTRVTVILPDGKVLGDSEKDPAKMDNHADRGEVREALRGRKGTSLRYSYTLRENMMYVAIPLRREGKALGVLRTSVSVSSIDRVLENIYLEVLAGGVVIAILASILSLVVSRRISRPLEEMRRGAERFAAGDFGPKMAVPDSLELGSFAEALNQMAAQLDERIRTVVKQRNEQDAVLASMIEGVLAVESSDRILSINRAAAALFDVDAEEVVGKKLHEVIRNTALINFIPRCLEGNEPREEEIILLGEEERYLQAHGAALVGVEGRRIGAVVVLNDVTELRRLERVRREFVANVSHELKTPVTAIKGAAETLQDGASRVPEDADRFLAVLSRQADRLNAIIEDLLLLARIEQGEERATIEREGGPIESVLEAAAQAVSPLAQEKDVRIELECETGLEAEFNSQILEHALVNLLDNAIKYSEKGGTVIVRGAREDDGLIVEVQDQGPGIPAEHLNRLFERFYRVDKARSRKLGGTGLGLAIVKHIARVHGGAVSVRSTPGEGSTFTIRIPAPDRP